MLGYLFAVRRRRAVFELQGIELIILALLFEQRFVGPFFHNGAVHESNDPVGIPDRGEAVRDHQGRPSLHQLIECILDLDFSLGVKRRGGFIEDQDRGVFQKRPGDRNALSFPSRKLYPLFTDDRLIAFGKPRDKIVGIGGLGGIDDILFALLNVSVCDILPDRIVEEDRLLSDYADLGA